MANIQLRITGMTCQNCVSHVSDELTDIDGVEDVMVTLDAEGTSDVHVVVKSEVTDNQLREAVDEAGDFVLVDIVR
ncbi:MAG: heavy-metal-associated domain-containing protein [Trueperella sp.]|nr:heavy-metal-associated domain-containing protein [Trueperella sp.]